jgi:streptomycin 3"-adenylyltransferase
LAVYLHGSAVAGGLHPGSDVDLLVVTDQPTTPEVRECLVAELRKVSGRHPADPNGPRPLELIVFQRADLMRSVYPVRSEFVYGEWLGEEFEAGVVPKPVSDPEFTLLLAQARQNAKILIGPDPATLLPIIPETDIRRAIGDALPALLDTLEGDERNVLLTLVRMWRTLTTGEFVSKDVAAEWAMVRLPAEPATLIACAREAYLGMKKNDWQTRRPEVRQVADDLGKRVAAML